MATFPSSIPSYAGFTSSHTLAADQHASQHNSEQGDITAIATKIGTGASTPVNQRLLRGNGTGTSAWAQADLTTDVTGVLPVANGGNGTTSTTGTGSAVFSIAPALTDGGSWGGSPTITTPTIADFTNANHGHQNAAGGGTLNAANALQANSVSFANLLNTIFSGQITTYTNPGSAGGTNSFFYGNIGGIKLFYGKTAAFTISGSGLQATSAASITLPVGFFSTISMVSTSIGSVPTGTSSLYATVQDLTGTTSVSVIMNQTLGSNGVAAISVLLIGT